MITRNQLMSHRISTSRLFVTFAFIPAFLASVLLSAASAAIVPAFSPTGGNNTGQFNQSTLLGFSFTPTANLSVSALGVYDTGDGFADRGNGLAVMTPVELYRVDSPSSGTLLQRVDVPAGNVASLIDGFRYVDVSPIDLVAGQQYEILSLHLSSGSEGVLAGAAVNPHLALSGVQSIGAQSNSFTDLQFISPLSVSGGPAFAPNFRFTAVPEPSSLVLLAVGLLGLRRMRRPGRKSTGICNLH